MVSSLPEAVADCEAATGIKRSINYQEEDVCVFGSGGVGVQGEERGRRDTAHVKDPGLF